MSLYDAAAARQNRPSAMFICSWAAIALSVALIIQFGLLSHPPAHRLLGILPRADLVWHMAAFACLSVPVFILFQPVTRAAACLLAMGGLLELAQLFVVNRQASSLDLVADAAGIALAVGFLVFVRRLDVRALFSVCREFARAV